MNWFPGHMKKSLNELASKRKIADVIIELRDARLPFTSANPDLSSDKKTIIVLTKSDLADLDKLTLAQEKLSAITLDKQSGPESIFKELKALNRKPLRALIIGIPNVGKSTLINKMKKNGGVKVENRPGVTRGYTFIHLPFFDLIDSPGILPMKFDNIETAYRLYLIGSIKDQVGDVQVIGAYLLSFLINNYPHLLIKRYGITDLTIEAIALRRNMKTHGDEIDYERVYKMLINEFRDGLIGRISFE